MKIKEKFIYHIISQNEWQEVKNKNTYHPVSLNTEGFIHCSFDHQIAGVITRYYSDRDDLFLMKIKINAITSLLKIEVVENKEAYPHLFGEINLDAVVGVYPLIRDNSNSYSWQEV